MYIVLRVMRLTYTRGLIRFSNFVGLSQLCSHVAICVLCLFFVVLWSMVRDCGISYQTPLFCLIKKPAVSVTSCSKGMCVSS